MRTRPRSHSIVVPPWWIASNVHDGLFFGECSARRSASYRVKTPERMATNRFWRKQTAE
jgi:hypothetical protein